MKFSLSLQSVQGEGVGGSGITEYVGNRMRFCTGKLRMSGKFMLMLLLFGAPVLGIVRKCVSFLIIAICSGGGGGGL